MNIYADDATLISSSRWDNITPMNDNIQKDLEYPTVGINEQNDHQREENEINAY